MPRLFLSGKWMAALGLLELGTAWSRAQPAPWQKTERGIDLTVGRANVELAVARPGVFRLSISYAGPALAQASTFVAPDASVPDWEMTTQGSWVGVKTTSGELRIDAQSGAWTLLDAQGATLIPPATLGQLATFAPVVPTIEVPHTDPALKKWTNVPVPDLGARPETARIDLPLTGGADARFYGAGNGATTLEQEKAESKTGNGLAIEPHYWSSDGYAALAVTSDDNWPAGWDLKRPSELTWHFPGKKADLYLMPASTLADGCRVFNQLIGTPPVPPRWSLGYLQSRWGWKDRAYIEDALNQFLSRHIPIDAFIYDFEWYTPENDYAVPAAGRPNFFDFSFNPGTFPQPEEQIDAYRKEGLHFVGIRKPRLGNSANVALLNENHWLLHPGITLDTPAARTGDFANRDFRAWYAAQSQPLLQKDIYGWWNDEGDGSFGSFTTYYYWNTAELAAMQAAKPDRRLWTLNRSFSPGVQRLGAAAWTGDIQAKWEILARTPTDLLNWTLAGMSYCTCDIGGYSPETNPQLLTRWMEAGVFFPVFRTHSEIGRTPHFPWLFGPDAEKAITAAIDLRYRLIPYYYSLAHEAHETGMPPMRALEMEFPDDPKVANLSDEWLMGPGLLAAPILTPENTRAIYLPAGADWFAFGSGTKSAGEQTLNVTAGMDDTPVYVRAGTILPLGPVVQNTDALPGGPLEVQIYPGRDASFTLVEDDGETKAYLQGAERRTTFKWDDAARKLSWRVEENYAGPHCFEEMQVRVFDPGTTAPTAQPATLSPAGSVDLPR